jgi:hypothetical protein
MPSDGVLSATVFCFRLLVLLSGLPVDCAICKAERLLQVAALRDQPGGLWTKALDREQIMHTRQNKNIRSRIIDVDVVIIIFVGGDYCCRVPESKSILQKY